MGMHVPGRLDGLQAAVTRYRSATISFWKPAYPLFPPLVSCRFLSVVPGWNLPNDEDSRWERAPVSYRSSHQAANWVTFGGAASPCCFTASTTAPPPPLVPVGPVFSSTPSIHLLHHGPPPISSTVQSTVLSYSLHLLLPTCTSPAPFPPYKRSLLIASPQNTLRPPCNYTRLAADTPLEATSLSVVLQSL